MTVFTVNKCAVFKYYTCSVCIFVFKLEDSSFQFAFYGEGYTDGQDPPQGQPNGKIRTLVQGPGNEK